MYWRVLFTSLIGCLLSFAGLSQLRYGNEWIVPGQSYAKISILSTGIYRISYEELASAGFPVSTLKPAHLQLFHRGRELAIRVQGEADGVFGTGDYIEFYARKNNGELDSLVYYQAQRANPYQSLFSDETFYFLTIGQLPGRRVEEPTARVLNLPVEPFHIEEQVTAYASQYSFNNLIGLIPPVQQSYFEDGEGWTGNFIVPDTAAQFAIALTNRVVTNTFQPVFEFQLNGRSQNAHKLWYSLSGSTTADTITFGPFSTKRITIPLGEQAIQQETIRLKTQNAKLTTYDWYSMTYLKVRYPQRFLMNGLTSKYFTLRPNTTNQSLVQVADLSANALLYDVTDPYTTRKITARQDQFVVDNTQTSRTILVSSDVKKANAISLVSFPTIDPRQYNYLIITHNTLLSSANQYAAYRASAAGGSYKPLVIETKSVYEQFNFGERSPMAIRRFADFMLSGGKDKYLFLLGRGISFPDILKTAATDDLVPTFGYPGSDALLTMGLAGYDTFVQAIPTGRINVTSNQQAINYLNKVKEFEQATPDDWQKRVLHLNGGHDQTEIVYLKNLLDQLRPVAESPYMGASVKVLSKKTFEEVESVDISADINAGVSMLSYIGHGSSNTLDFNFGYCSSPGSNINNKGKYPVMFFNGCSINNLFYKYDPLSTDWLITPDKGAIAVLAGSFWSYPNYTQQYGAALYQKFFADTTSLGLTLGKIQQQVNQTLSAHSGDLTLRADMQQIILQGDPALHLFPLTKPDYAARSVFIQSQNTVSTIASSDSLNVNLIFSNVGKFIPKQPVSFSIKRTYTNGQQVSQRLITSVNAVRDTLMVSILKDLSLTRIDILLDSDGQIDELSESNNLASIDLTNWTDIQKNSIYPINALPDQLNPVLTVLIDRKAIRNGDYVAANPVVQVNLTDENQLSPAAIAAISTYIRSCSTCAYELLVPQSTTIGASGGLVATYQMSSLKPGTYELLATGRDAAGNAAGLPYTITFVVADSPVSTQWIIYPNPGDDLIQMNYTVVSQSAPLSATVFVYNTQGAVVDVLSATPSVGENVIYWTNCWRQPAGTYTATLELNWPSGQQEQLKRKFIKR